MQRYSLLFLIFRWFTTTEYQTFFPSAANHKEKRWSVRCKPRLRGLISIPLALPSVISVILGTDRFLSGDSAIEFMLLNTEPLDNNLTAIHDLISGKTLLLHSWMPRSYIVGSMIATYFHCLIPKRGKKWVFGVSSHKYWQAFHSGVRHDSNSCLVQSPGKRFGRVRLQCTHPLDTIRNLGLSKEHFILLPQICELND